MKKEIAMSIQRISIIAATALVLGAVGASAGDLPQYEVTGFPISPLQFSVLGSGGVQEQSLTSALTIDGMPASPHQIAVISPRTEQQAANKLNIDASGTQHVDD
jgi:hypothetical protein